jgi:hypothetical protein
MTCHRAGMCVFGMAIVANEAAHVVTSGAFAERLMRVMAGCACGARIVWVVAPASLQPIGLKTHSPHTSD